MASVENAAAPARPDTANETKTKKGVFGKAFASLKNKYVARHAKTDVEKKYKLGKELGTGNFAVVKLGTKRSCGTKYAIKIIDKALCAGKDDMIEMELAVLKQASHAHIVGMHEHFDTPSHLYLVLDYVDGGELFDRIVDEGNFTEQDASRITKQMTEAIQYLHDRKIVHRDLKPENLLFASRENTDRILVTDFGLAKLIDDQTTLMTACGTPNYVAPEILLQKGYGKEVDVWSLGVILYILLCGYPPFYDESDAVLFEMIMKGKFDFDARYWGDVSKEAKSLIRNMLIVDPARRLTTQQVLSHPWITGITDLPNVNLSKSISTNLKKHFSYTTPQIKSPEKAKATTKMAEPVVEAQAAARTAPTAQAAAPIGTAV